MDVPEHVRALRQAILQRDGGRKDDVEFTFVKGRWNHLGEATLMNRVKSHPDVGERWYPDLLAQIRAQQAADAAKVKAAAEEDERRRALGTAVQPQQSTVQAH